MTGILIRTKRFGNRDTHVEGRRPWDGRAEIGAMGTPRVAGSHKKPRERIVTDSPQGHRRGHGPAGIWFSDF